MLATLLLASVLGAVEAFPTFPAAIPNGVSVPCPSQLTQAQAAEQCTHLGAQAVCKAVGHVDCRGGDFPDANGDYLNAFGKDFRDAGRQWTKELCEADSDGDGKTNGEELGDPCCVWQPTQPSPVPTSYRISHPGLPGDTTDSQGPTAAECKALQDSKGVATAFTEADFADSIYNPGEERLNLTFRVEEHTLLTNETVYTRTFFPLPQDKDYYVVGYLADIVNKVHVHHFVVYLCTDVFSNLYLNTTQPLPGFKAGFPEQPVNEKDNGLIPEPCLQNAYIWAPGGDRFSLPKNMAIKFGKSTPYKALFLEIHYNNPEAVPDATDSSGFTAFYTPKAREIEATWWWSGSTTRVGTIPPKTERYFNIAECQVDLKPGCDSIQVLGNSPHAHTLGMSIWTEHYRADPFGPLTYLGDITRENQFNYELQYMRMFDKEITVRHNDLLVTTCMYDSMDRDEPTEGGLASKEEMCLDFLLIYPAQCVRSSVCISLARIVSGEAPPTAKPPYHSADFYTAGGAPNFTAIHEQGLATCDAELVFDNPLFGADANPINRLFTAMSFACPGLIGADQEFLEPEEALQYMCPESCSQWALNYGVCSVSDLQAEHELLLNVARGASPLVAMPPSCFVAITKNITEASGGTYKPLEAPPPSERGVISGSEAAPPAEEATSSAPAATPSKMAVCLSVVGLVGAAAALLL